MIRKNDIRSISSLEGFLLLLFIILVVGFLFLIGAKFSGNTMIFSFLILCLLILISLVTAIGLFQFVKYKYVEALKNEIIEDLKIYKNKADIKISETNSRIFFFEKNYSKKIMKISKDYSIKAKEINDIKKALDIKLIELDRKAASLEIEFYNMKVENLKSKGDDLEVNEEILHLYKRIIELNTIYPGISSDEALELIHLKLSSRNLL
jgi:hypothetical protein